MTITDNASGISARTEYVINICEAGDVFSDASPSTVVFIDDTVLSNGGIWLDTNYIETANGLYCDYALSVTSLVTHTTISPGTANDKVDKFWIVVPDA